MCITALYIKQDIVIVFTITFKCLLNFLKTFVYFTMLQEENYFYTKKTFTPKEIIRLRYIVDHKLIIQLRNKYKKNTVCVCGSGKQIIFVSSRLHLPHGVEEEEPTATFY